VTYLTEGRRRRHAALSFAGVLLAGLAVIMLIWAAVIALAIVLWQAIA
jgi:hypothetical protein